MEFGAISRDFECKLLRPRNFFRKFRSEIRSESHAISRAAACRRSAQLLGTSEGRGQAVHHPAAWILARILTENFANFSRSQNFAFEIARDRAKIRCAPRAAAWPRPIEVSKQFAERRHAAAREIRCDSERISDRNFRKVFAAAKPCDRKSARSHRNPLCTTCDSLTDVPRFVKCPKSYAVRGIWCDLTRFRMRPRIFFRNFGRKAAPNRTQFHAPQHADARHSCWGPLKAVGKLCTTRRHGVWREF